MVYPALLPLMRTTRLPVASNLHTTSEHGVTSITTADAHISVAISRLNWRTLADLNGLVRFAERRNLVSARVPSHFNWPLSSDVCKRVPTFILRAVTQRQMLQHLGINAITSWSRITFPFRLCVPMYRRHFGTLRIEKCRPSHSAHLK